nr:hypothetical protein [Limnobaculum parvum]
METPLSILDSGKGATLLGYPQGDRLCVKAQASLIGNVFIGRFLSTIIGWEMWLAR